ncbi:MULTISPECIES: LamG-like jellyroll fold domain-containing protein [unclassified Mesorhizobium]|uniref:LamG-like jellyroll fold domain-containing protein n=1 Tax=unclassified Mesorhizobium TaxID=325217 RepID=UPI0024154BEC|nr:MULTISPECIES: LamG-like jellyroll fold domain-containing protein [unclassified Mesorhizobium]MDG4854072.1 LamG domain-containing protein [Mesorhizobium sp. WSM4982]MDG4910912.1 LamG domain-containing protein [Mesorhizobium sp. WSM4983]
MARSFAGGTDRLQWTVPGSLNGTAGCFTFRLKTTQTTTNAAPIAYWNTSSRNGLGFVLNNTANKILAQGYSFSAAQVSISSTSNINDGNWRSVAFNYNQNSGGANALFIDGVQEATVNTGANWGINANTDICAGDLLDSFWPSYVGDIAEIGHWNTQLDAAEIAALANGFSPMLVRPASLIFYAPVVRETRELRAGLAGNTTGGSVSDHPRKIGPGC